MFDAVDDEVDDEPVTGGGTFVAVFAEDEETGDGSNGMDGYLTFGCSIFDNVLAMYC